MLVLASTSDEIELTLSVAHTVDIQASWVDYNSSAGTYTPGRLNQTYATATTPVVVVASPASGVVRVVKSITVNNVVATNTITVEHTDGTNVVTLWSVSMGIGYTVTYEGTGFDTRDGNGNLVVTTQTGRLIRRTLLTGTSGTYQVSLEATTLKIYGVGGGGAGTGAGGTSGDSAAGGGGGAGSYAEYTATVTGGQECTYTCGAGGTSPAVSGGSSTFVIGATTVTCNGGTSAANASPATTLTIRPGQAGGTVSTNGTLNTTGDPGSHGFVLIVGGPPTACSGDGGSSPFGAGAVGVTAVGVGNNASGYGAGGSGGVSGTAGTAEAGGSGSPGCWLVEEYS